MQSVIVLVLSTAVHVQGLTITIQAFPSTSVVEGRPLTLNCTMTSVPSTLRTCHIEWTRNYNSKAAVTTQLLTTGNGTQVLQQSWSHGTMTSSLAMQSFRMTNTGRYNCALRCGHLGQIIGSTSADIYRVGGRKRHGEEQTHKGVLEIYGVENLVGIIIVMVSVLACSVVVIVLTRPFSALRRGAPQRSDNLAARSPGNRSNEISIELPPSYSFMFPRDDGDVNNGGDGSSGRSPGEIDPRSQHPGQWATNSPTLLTPLPDYSFALRDLKAKGLVESPLELSPAPPTYASIRLPESCWNGTGHSATPRLSNVIHLPSHRAAERPGTNPSSTRPERQNPSSTGQMAENLYSARPMEHRPSSTECYNDRATPTNPTGQMVQNL